MTRQEFAVVASSLSSTIALVIMLIAGRWEDSTVADVVWLGAFSFLLMGLLFRARAGYRRRLPHWTRESWRRFFTVAAMFATLLLVSIAMAAAVEYRLPIVGAAQSTQRTIWVIVMMAFMLAGVIGLTSAVIWLGEGDDPSKQFTRFQKRARA